MTQVGYTYFNDPPPGAGGLNNKEYCFAELGTATRSGQATGVGNLARAMGKKGELPIGTHVTFSANGKSITGVKRDRGYGQGGDGVNSDPSFAVDFWDGTSYGGKNPMAALGLTGGSGKVTVGGSSGGGILDTNILGVSPNDVLGLGNDLTGGVAGNVVTGAKDIGSAIGWIFSANGIDRILKVLGGGVLVLLAANELMKAAGTGAPQTLAKAAVL